MVRAERIRQQRRANHKEMMDQLEDAQNTQSVPGMATLERTLIATRLRKLRLQRERKRVVKHFWSQHRQLHEEIRR
jgi:hypothetical protein